MFNQINWHDVIAFAKKHDRAILAVVTGGAAIAAAWCSAVETSQMSDDIKDVLANPEATIVDKGKAVAESHKMTLVALGIALTSAVFGYKCGAEAIAGISAVAAGALAEGDNLKKEARKMLGDKQYNELMRRVQEAEKKVAEQAKELTKKDADKKQTFTDNFLTKKVKTKLELNGKTIWFETSMSKINWVEHEFNYAYYTKRRVTAEDLLDMFGINDRAGMVRNRIDARNLVWDWNDFDHPYEYIMFTPWFDDTDQCVVVDIETDPVIEVLQLEHKNANTVYRERGFIE